MNKNLTVLFAIFWFATTYGQTEKGNYIIGTSTNFSINSSKSKLKTDTGTTNIGDNFSIALLPTIGYFVIDNLAVGAGLYLGYRKSEHAFVGFPEEIVSKAKMTSIQFSPFVNYYFSNSNVRPFLTGSVGIGGSKESTEITNSDEMDSKHSIFTYRFGGGLAIFLNNSVSVNLGLDYDSSSIQEKGSDNNLKHINSSFGLTTGFSIYL